MFDDDDLLCESGREVYHQRNFTSRVTPVLEREGFGTKKWDESIDKLLYDLNHKIGMLNTYSRDCWNMSKSIPIYRPGCKSSVEMVGEEANQADESICKIEDKFASCIGYLFDSYAFQFEAELHDMIDDIGQGEDFAHWTFNEKVARFMAREEDWIGIFQEFADKFGAKSNKIDETISEIETMLAYIEVLMRKDEIRKLQFEYRTFDHPKALYLLAFGNSRVGDTEEEDICISRKAYDVICYALNENDVYRRILQEAQSMGIDSLSENRKLAYSVARKYFLTDCGRGDTIFKDCICGISEWQCYFYGKEQVQEVEG